MSVRRYTFKLYPNAVQRARLEEIARLHSALYNALLQQRIEAYSRQRRTLTYFDQCKELTALRAQFPEYAALSSDSMAATAQRLDRAYQAFFRRCKAGHRGDAGFPRFRRVESFGCKKHGSGWRFDEARRRLYLKSVPGLVRWRGRFPAAALALKCCEVMLRAGDWWLSIAADMPPRARAAGENTGEVRFDLVDRFAIVKIADGARGAGPEEAVSAAPDGRIGPRYQGVVATSAGDAPETGAGRGGRAIEELQRRMARCRRGSAHYRRLRARKRRREFRLARQRREGLHEWTSALIARVCALIIRAPAIRDNTRTPRGDAKHWGAHVEAVSALNRNTLNQAPAAALQMLRYKAEEAGIRCEVVDDEAPKIAVGGDLVHAGKEARRARRTLKRIIS